jgi:hypothetical protein
MLTRKPCVGYFFPTHTLAGKQHMHFLEERMIHQKGLAIRWR